MISQPQNYSQVPEHPASDSRNIRDRIRTKAADKILLEISVNFKEQRRTKTKSNGSFIHLK